MRKRKVPVAIVHHGDFTYLLFTFLSFPDRGGLGKGFLCLGFFLLEGGIVAHGTAIAFFVAATDHHGLAVDYQVFAFRLNILFFHLLFYFVSFLLFNDFLTVLENHATVVFAYTLTGEVVHRLVRVELYAISLHSGDAGGTSVEDEGIACLVGL